MNKLGFVAAVATHADLSPKVSRAAVEAIIHAITASLAQGQKVNLRGLGTFTIRQRAASMARNPRTGELFTLAAFNRVYFKPSRLLKEGCMVDESVVAAPSILPSVIGEPPRRVSSLASTALDAPSLQIEARS